MHKKKSNRMLTTTRIKDFVGQKNEIVWFNQIRI